MNVILEILLAYLAYRFIAGFLLPLYRTTSQIRRQFQKMSSQPPPTSPGSQPPPAGNGKSETTESDSSKVGEYIDFEEVK